MYFIVVRVHNINTWTLAYTHTQKKKNSFSKTPSSSNNNSKKWERSMLYTWVSLFEFLTLIFIKCLFFFFFNSRTALQVLWEKEKVSVLFIQLLFWRFHCLTFGFWLPQKRGEKKIRRACGVTLVLSFRYEIRPHHTTYKHSLSFYSSFFFFYF